LLGDKFLTSYSNPSTAATTDIVNGVTYHVTLLTPDFMRLQTTDCLEHQGLNSYSIATISRPNTIK
ncbi:hypothetical protein, partial [Staphylococcus pseudintermedius]|uniref:hypothetical protein n=1 Tax=Staphylococcus pseudintermedius TaxID=283734 RepID=UPI001E2C33F6